MSAAAGSAAAARALAERLIAIPSHSGDRGGESWLARTLLESLPAAAERGEWKSDEGRPVVWARVRGRKPGRALLLLGHFDTVGVAEYAGLGGIDGERIAYDPARTAATLAASRRLRAADAALDRALDEEAAHPGTWLFGRGGLDMKAGLAAGVAALEALAREPAGGDVVFVATPDEERESRGMLAACEALAAFAAREGVEFAGALNLDFTEAPIAYHGVVGKALVSLVVRGVPTHAGAPFAGVDASQLAADVASALASSEALADRWHGWTGAPPVILGLRDLKPVYDAQTALEAAVELNVLSYGRPLDETLSRVRRIAEGAVRASLERRRSLAERLGATVRDEAPRVLGFAELPPPAAGADLPVGSDPRSATLARIRAGLDALGAEGPVVVVSLLPPFYPALAPRESGFAAAVRRVLEPAGVELRPFYPYVSDASYLAWPGPDAASLAAWMPALDRELRLPIAAMRALDLDVVNLGPWGAGAHTVAERAYAPWTFGTLPGLIERIAREA